MFKIIVLSATIFASATMAFDLKSNMLQLNAELSEVQRSFIVSDPVAVKASVDRFAKHAEELLSDKDKFAQMLPPAKRAKAGEAAMSAQIIKHNVEVIRDALDNKHNKSGRVRREEAQRAYTYIEHACFRCHNIVRDKY